MSQCARLGAKDARVDGPDALCCFCSPPVVIPLRLRHSGVQTRAHSCFPLCTCFGFGAQICCVSRSPRGHGGTRGLPTTSNMRATPYLLLHVRGSLLRRPLRCMSSIKRGVHSPLSFWMFVADCPFSTEEPPPLAWCPNPREAPSPGEHVDTRLLPGVAVRARGRWIKSGALRWFPPTLTTVFV